MYCRESIIWLGYTPFKPKIPRQVLFASLIAQRESAELRTPMNAWLLYNGFNNALYHAESKLLPEERERVDRRVLAVIENELSLS